MNKARHNWDPFPLLLIDAQRDFWPVTVDQIVDRHAEWSRQLEELAGEGNAA